MNATFEQLEKRTLLSGDAFTVTIEMLPHVREVYVAYEGSAFEGDAAIATDKTPLRPGKTATFANYTSYPEGITGVVVDVHKIPDTSEIDATDFVFRVGNSDYFKTWEQAPDPSEVVIAGNGGVGGADRVFIRWPDGAIVDAWLSIELLPDDFGLRPAYEFDHTRAEPYIFGNLRGENTGDFWVNYDDVFDVIWPRLDTLADVDSPADINRDGQVNVGDVEAVWPYLFKTRLPAITPSSVDPRVALHVAFGQLQAERDAERDEWFSEIEGHAEWTA